MLSFGMVALAVLGAAAADEAARDEAIAAARAALAGQPGLKSEAIEVVEAVATQWPDSGLGCGDGRSVAPPGVTPGYRVLLRIAGAIHPVHVGAGRAVVCSPPLAVAERQPQAEARAAETATPEPEAPAQRALVAKAREDLARRLSLAPADVTLVKFKEVVWPDRGLGCPRPGVVYPQASVDGALILLEAGGLEYAYHAGGERGPFLCETKAPSP